MEDVNKWYDIVSNIGIPMVVTIFVFIVLYKAIKYIPTAWKNYIDNKNKIELAQQKRYEDLQSQFTEQIKVITAVAQQGIEAQRRGNDVIERNNILIEGNQRIIEKMTLSLENSNRQTLQLYDEIKTNTQLTRDTYTEVIKIKERID